MLSYSYEKKNAIEHVGDGTFWYNYDFEETESEEVILWRYKTVLVNEVSEKEILKRVIDEEYGNGLEEKLINDYNSYFVGILTDVKYEERYIAYLNDRKRLKEMIVSDVEDYQK